MLQRVHASGHETDQASAPDLRCKCGFPYITKSSKSRLNYNRKYWTCGSTGSTCGFFEWTPSKAVILSQQSDIATPATGGSGTGHASQNGEYAVDGSQTGPSCHCGLPVRRSSIKAGPNAGRDKLSCPSGDEGCDYHAIADDVLPTQQALTCSQPVNTPSQPVHHQYNSQQHTPPNQPLPSSAFSPGHFSQASQSPVGYSQPARMQSQAYPSGSLHSQPVESVRNWLPASQASTQPQDSLSQSFSQASQASGANGQTSGGFSQALQPPMNASNQAMHRAMDAAMGQTLQPLAGGHQGLEGPPQAVQQPEKLCSCSPPQVCVIRKSKQKKSLGREVFFCPRPPGQQCKGWQGWVDEFQPLSQGAPQHQAQTNVVSPRPSQGRNEMRCWNCNQLGHWKKDCPLLNDGMQNV